jgi:hypothetical protein
MRDARHCRRMANPLASPPAVCSVCLSLRDRMPYVIPPSAKQLITFSLYGQARRRPTTDTPRGRPSQWEREKLVEGDSHLRSILERETKGRVSVNSSTGQYVPLLQFPSGQRAARRVERAGHFGQTGVGRVYGR